MTQQSGHQFDAALLSGPGIVVNGDIDYHGGLEVSMFYMRSIYSVRKENKTLTEKTKRMFIGMGYRHWFNKKLGVAAAFTSAYSMGDAEVLRDDFGNTAKPGTSARDITEYGVELSVQHEPYSYKSMSVLLDARYNYSLTAKKNEDANHFGLLVGLKFFIQSADKRIFTE